MKKLIPILVLLFATVSSYAQNWNVFVPGLKQYFVNKEGYVRGMRLDSISYSGSDVVYYPFKTPRGNYNDWTIPLDSTKGSWLGGKVIRKTDGTFLFDNNWGDTVVIKTRAAVGESWVFYHDSSSYYYEAEVIAIDTMSVMGIVDSVRRINISAFDGSNMNPADSLHGFEIILSKSNGFVQVFDLYIFPYHPHDTVYALGMDLFLDVSLNTHQPGAHGCLFRISDYDYVSSSHQHDWQVGDVVYYGQSLGGSIWHGPPYANYLLDTIKQVITSGNSTHYASSGWIAWLAQSQHSIYDIEYYDTMPPCGYCWEIDITLMPEEKRQAVHWFYYPEDTSYCSTAPLYRFSKCFLTETYHYDLGMGVGTYGVDYKQGLGMVKAGGMNGDYLVHERVLLYYNTGGVECGTFVFPDTVLPVSVMSANAEASKIYPNPANELLNVETSLQSCHLSLINAIGQVVYRKEAFSGKQVIDVRNFTNGIYYLKIETPEHETINRKIIIQH